MAYVLKARVIGPEKTEWKFDDMVGYSCMGSVDLVFWNNTRTYLTLDGDIRPELIALLSDKERAAAVAAAIDPPTDRALTKIYFNWQPPTNQGA